MSPTFKPRQGQQGSSLIEVLVTLVILMVGLLGLVGLMVQSQRAQMESYQRAQALIVLQDMVNRINTNRKAAACYVITTSTNGTPFLGTGSTVSPTCPLSTPVTAEQSAQAVRDMSEWNDLLLGNAENSGGTNVGAMLGARGCVSLVSTGVYQVSVVWQGNGKTVAPAGVTCGTDLFGDDKQRRAVTAPLQIATLS